MDLPRITYPITFNGRTFSVEELRRHPEPSPRTARALARTELAYTLCELLDWRRPTGRLKNHEGRLLLEHLETKGLVTLPPVRAALAPPGAARRAALGPGGARARRGRHGPRRRPARAGGRAARPDRPQPPLAGADRPVPLPRGARPGRRHPPVPVPYHMKTGQLLNLTRPIPR